MPESKNILIEDLGNGVFRQTETTGAPAVVDRIVYTDATRPDAATFLAGMRIWNTDDAAYNYSTGSQWVDALGNLT